MQDGLRIGEYDGLPPIYGAISSNNIAALENILQSDDIDINEGHDELINPLHHAIGRGNYDIVKLLIEHNAMVDAPPPLIAQNSHLIQAIRLLHDYKVDSCKISSTNEKSRCTCDFMDGTCPLQHDSHPERIVDLIICHYSTDGAWFLPPNIIFHDETVLAEFLKRKVDVNARDDKRRTPLYHALLLSKPLTMIRTLLEAGASTNYIYANNDNALHIALIYYPKHSQSELFQIIRLLLDYCADPNTTRCMSNMSPLHLATTQGVSHHIMQLLISHGGDLTIRAYDRSNILHSCVKHSKDKDGLLTETIVSGYLASILSKDGVSDAKIEEIIDSVREAEPPACSVCCVGRPTFPRQPSASRSPQQPVARRKKRVGPQPRASTRPDEGTTSLYKYYYLQLQQQQPRRYIFPHLKLKKPSSK